MIATNFNYYYIHNKKYIFIYLLKEKKFMFRDKNILFYLVYI